MKKLDLAVIVFVAVLSLLPLLLFPRGGKAQTVCVTQRGETVYEGPLARDAVVAAEGCTVTVESGSVRVTEADCPDGLCLKAGAATAAHPVVCLPNELVVTVSDTEEALDGIAY